MSPSKKARSCLFDYSKRIKPDFDDLRADDGEDTIITVLDLRRNNRRKNFEQQIQADSQHKHIHPSEKQRCQENIFGCRTTACRGPCTCLPDFSFFGGRKDDRRERMKHTHVSKTLARKLLVLQKQNPNDSASRPRPKDFPWRACLLELPIR